MDPQHEQNLSLPLVMQTFGKKSLPTIHHRKLREVLEIKKREDNWIKNQLERASLVEGGDYLTSLEGRQVPHQGGVRTVTTTEYYLTLEAAKIICMMSQSKMGNAYRRYLVKVEDEWLAGRGRSSPPQITQERTIRDCRTTAKRMAPAGSKPVDLDRIFLKLLREALPNPSPAIADAMVNLEKSLETSLIMDSPQVTEFWAFFDKLEAMMAAAGRPSLNISATPKNLIAFNTKSVIAAAESLSLPPPDFVELRRWLPDSRSRLWVGNKPVFNKAGSKRAWVFRALS